MPATLRRICLATVLPVVLFGCSQHTGEPLLPTAPPEPAPPATSAVGVVQLFRWSWNNRDYDHYRTLFTADYSFQSLIDTAGHTYRSLPWTRDDELINAKDLFEGGTAGGPAISGIQVRFEGPLEVQSDDRPGKTYPVHERIETTVVFVLTYAGGAVSRLEGLGRFYVVRGDSARIPNDLNLPSDERRWSIERWEDGTDFRGPHPR